MRVERKQQDTLRPWLSLSWGSFSAFSLVVTDKWYNNGFRVWLFEGVIWTKLKLTHCLEEEWFGQTGWANLLNGFDRIRFQSLHALQAGIGELVAVKSKRGRIERDAVTK